MSLGRRGAAAAPLIIRVAPFALEMREEPEHADEQWMPFWAAQEYPMRMIALTVDFDLAQPLTHTQDLLQPLDLRATRYAPLAQAVDDWAATGVRPELEALVAGLPTQLREEVQRALPAQAGLEHWQWVLDRLGQPLWRRPYLRDYAHWYERLMARVPLRALQHYLIAWPPATERVPHLPGLIEQTFDTRAWVDGLPTIWRCPYTERGGILWPDDPQHPVAVILSAYDFGGTWASGDLLHRLFQLNLDMALAIDVVPVNRTKAELKAEWQVTVQENRQARGERDIKADKRKLAAEELQELLDTQALHEVSVHIAVFAADIDALEFAMRQIRLAAGARMKLLHARGVQAALAQFFAPTPTRRIDAGPSVRPRSLPSHGVAAMTPFGMRKPERTDGILWMFQGDTPIMFNPFTGGSAAHMVMVGKTGFGKTFAVNVWLLRLLCEGCRVVMLEPQGHSRRLVTAAHQGGVRFALTARDILNPLDVVVAFDDEGRAPVLAEQIEHVIGQLSILLGQNQRTFDGSITGVAAKPWTTIERALLDLALQRVYAPFDLTTLTPERTPLLAELVAALRTLATEFAGADAASGVAAAQLATELELSLVRGSTGVTFNAHTTVDLSLVDDLTAYGLEGLPEGRFRTYYFGQLFGAINRYVRNPRRDRERPLIVVFDEFAYTVQRIPALAQFAELATRTWRTFNAHFWAMDQTIHAYAGVEGGVANEHLLAMWQQATLRVVFRQDADPARRLQTLVEGLRPAHVDAIKTFNVGDAMIIWEANQESDQRHHDLWIGHIESTDAEFRAFDGT